MNSGDLPNTGASGVVPGLTAEAVDPVLEVFKGDIDFTLVEKNFAADYGRARPAVGECHAFSSAFPTDRKGTPSLIVVTDFELTTA